MADDGLLEVQYRRLTGRSGPGAGRPAKLYRRPETQFELTMPARNPGLVGRLLAEAVERAGQDADPVRRALRDSARDAGAAVARPARVGRSDAQRRRALAAVLEQYGYAPAAVDGELSLTNCPYEPLSSEDGALVCGMNLAFVEGAASGVGLQRVTCILREQTGGGCCVHVGPWPTERS